MQTSAIHQRVADFLKAYPPFSFLDAGALERLTAGGRVFFREKDDLIFQEGQERSRFLYVVQRGSVRLSTRRGEDAVLVDLRGQGDIFGLGGILGETHYAFSAHAQEDTILYALDVHSFTRECELNPRAGRFLSILFSSDTSDPGADVEESGGLSNWFRAPGPSPEWTETRLLTCPPHRSIREAARAMIAVDDGPMLVVDQLGRPLGIFTDLDLCERVATGDISVDAPVSRLMHSPVFTISPEASVGESLLQMMRRGCRHLCMTQDGTTATRAVGIVSERDVMMFYGNNPLIILRSMHFAEDLRELAILRDRADFLVRAGLRSFRDVDWYCEIVSEINRALLRRIVELLRPQEGGEVLEHACVVLTGSAGRHEMLARTQFDTVLMLSQPGKWPRDACHRLSVRINDALRQCGFAQSSVPGMELGAEWCGDVETWQQRFRDWVAHPVEGGIYRRLGLFDLEPLSEWCPAGVPVRQALQEALRANPNFIPILANDSLGNNPPLTIFEGYAVDVNGRPLEELDIKNHAIRAVSDAARVLAFEAGDLSSRTTLARLRSAGARLPEAADVLNGAARAFRIALYQRTLNAFRTGGDGSVLSPAALSRTDQALLKSSFAAIARLLGFIAHRYGLE